MGVAVLVPGTKRRVELEDEPLAFARSVLSSLGASLDALPVRIARETEGGFSYAPADVGHMVHVLEAALTTLDDLIDADGRPRAHQAASPASYFNERQRLRATLALFRAAEAESKGVEVSL